MSYFEDQEPLKLINSKFSFWSIELARIIPLEIILGGLFRSLRRVTSKAETHEEQSVLMSRFLTFASVRRRWHHDKGMQGEPSKWR